MREKFYLLLIIAITILLIFPTPALADGIIVPDPPLCDPHPCPPPPCPGPFPCPVPSPISQLAIRYHHVDVTIKDQVVVTHVDQVFYNPNDWQVEGTYIFPIPVDAAVTSFTLWVDGQPVEGQILDAQEARRTYEDIVHNMRDPALLEYVGQGAMQARIFPIPPQGERRVELEYSQVLPADNGLVRYVYPLNTEKFSL
jgi:Ca-activated chloride channel family protein